MSPIYACSACDALVVDLQQEAWLETALVGDGWRHLHDNTPLCEAGAPSILDEPTQADPDAVEWDLSVAPDTTQVAGIVSDLLLATRSQALAMANLSQHLRERAASSDPADVALAGRASGRLAHVATLQARAAASLAASWLATRHRDTAGADSSSACGCPPLCACCGAAPRDGHDPDCPWQRGSAAHEEPVIAPEPTVRAAHTHLPGCPQAARRPGGLFEAINTAGDVQCLTCAAVNTMDGDNVDSDRGTAEHHHHWCTACGGRWSWCTMRAVA